MRRVKTGNEPFLRRVGLDVGYVSAGPASQLCFDAALADANEALAEVQEKEDGKKVAGTAEEQRIEVEVASGIPEEPVAHACCNGETDPTVAHRRFLTASRHARTVRREMPSEERDGFTRRRWGRTPPPEPSWHV